MYGAGLTSEVSSWMICVNGNRPLRLFPYLVHKMSHLFLKQVAVTSATAAKSAELEPENDTLSEWAEEERQSAEFSEE